MKRKTTVSLTAGLIAGMMLLSACGSTAPAAVSASASASNDSAAATQSAESASASASESASESAPAESAGTPVEIEYWYSWTDKIQQNNENLTKQFNETVGKDKNIHVTAAYQGSYEDLHQKLQAAHVAGSTPAVTVMEIASIGTFAKNGVLEPLDAYIEKSGTNISDFLPGLMGNSSVDGKLYGLPYLRSTPILYLNTTILKAAGLDPAGPKTWDELAQYCGTIKEKTGKYGLSTFSYIWTFEAFLMQNGTTVLSEDELHSNLGAPETREVVKFFQDLKKKDDIRIVAGADSDKINVDIMNQNAAMWFNSTANLTNNLKIASENGFEIATCFMPARKNYGCPTGGANLIMASKISDEQKQASWEFINWMTSTEQTIYASSFTGYMPSRKSAIESDAMKKLYVEKPQFKVAVDQLQYASKRPMNPNYAEVSKAIVSALDACWVNDQEVDPVFDELQKKAESLLGQ